MADKTGRDWIIIALLVTGAIVALAALGGRNPLWFPMMPPFDW